MLKRDTYGVLRGGLGNQLFQISAYSALAKRGGRKLVLDLNSYRHPSQIALSRIPSALALDLVTVERALSFRNPVFSRFIVAIHWAMRLTFDSIPGLQGKFRIVAIEKAVRRLGGIQGNKSYPYLDSYFGGLYKDEDLDEAISQVTDSLANLSKKLLPKNLFPEEPWSALHIRMGDYLTVDPSKIIS